MRNYYKVAGNDGLLKDPSTGSVINADVNAYNAYKKKKERNQQEKQKIESLESRIRSLEETIERLIEKR